MANSPAPFISSFHSSNGGALPSLASQDGSKPATFQRSEGNDYHDPVLQYINDLLMEEETIEDESCTLHESMDYQATVKSFSEILNNNNEPTSSGKFTFGEEFRVSEQDFHPFTRGEGFLVSQTDLYPLNTSEEHHRQELNELCLNPIEAQAWKRLLHTVSETSSIKPSETGFRLQQEPTACVPRNTNRNTKHDFWNECLKQQFSNEQTLNASLRSQFANEIWKQKISHGSFRQHVSNSSSDGFIFMPGSFDSTRIKRSSPKENNPNDDDIPDGQEDSVSFVQNEILRGEDDAKAINEGMSEIIGRLKISGPRTSIAPKSHKSSAHQLTTTADLKSMLLSCAQALADGNKSRANEILKEIRQESTPYGSDLQRLAHYFAEGLVARMTGTGAMVYTALSNNVPSASRWLKAHRLLVYASPYHKIHTLFANRAIVETVKDSCRLHIIDYGIRYGVQWPSLISALAERKGGPPFLQMTVIDFPDPGNIRTKNVEWVGKKLSEYARAYGVPFEYRVVAAKLESITASTVGLRDGEILVVNSFFTLHKVPDESVMPSDPRATILKNILDMNPKLFIHGVAHGNHTSPFFMPRFREALSHFSSIFDMMESIVPRDNQNRFFFEREFHGKEIMNVVACEGHERDIRHITYKQWQSKIKSVGFVQVCLDGKMVKDIQDTVRLHYNKNFYVDSDGNWMLVGWKGKVNLAMALYKP